MIAGILDAMRSEFSPATRLVWQCLENHANGARFWSMTDQEIPRELHLSTDSVSRAMAELEQGRIVRCVRHKRRRATFHMLRSYPEGCARPRHEPEVERRGRPELSPQFAETRSPQRRSTGRTESAAGFAVARAG